MYPRYASRSRTPSPDPAPFPCPWALSCRRVRRCGPYARGDAFAGIGHGEQYIFARSRDGMLLDIDVIEVDQGGLDFQLASVRHGIASVRSQVQHDLFDFRRIGLGNFQIVSQRDPDMNVLSYQPRQHVA